jgi:DNA-binding NarL/FixJ family response regulator
MTEIKRGLDMMTNFKEKAVETALKLVVIDDEPLLRAGIASIVATMPGWRIEAEADNARAAFPVVERTAPDVVLLDLVLPGMDGISALRELVRRSPSSRVLILSTYRNPRDVLEAFTSGASGYAIKSEPPDNVIQAIQGVARGERYVSPLLPTNLVGRLRRVGRGGRIDGDPLGELSAREREIFSMVVRGASNREIARELCISLKTVDAHRRRINEKLSCHCPADLVRYAAVNGLLKEMGLHAPAA